MAPLKHLLIVDDYPDAVDIWAFYLRSQGYRVTTAGDGASAIEKAERLLPDLIVLDLELPEVSGFDVARRLRANPDTQPIPIIAATGYSLPIQLERARQAGVDEIFVKPCDPDSLALAIDRHLTQPPRTIVPAAELVAVKRGHNNG